VRSRLKPSNISFVGKAGSWLAGLVRVAACGRSGNGWSIVSSITVRDHIQVASIESVYKSGLAKSYDGRAVISKPSSWRLAEEVTNNAAHNLSAMKGCTTRVGLKEEKAVWGNWDVLA
jgi:hypothetical protein